LLKSLILGNQFFPINLIQGPLAGVSCAPFRALTWRYSQPAFTCTEMISCKTLLYQPVSSQKRYIKKSVDEGPVCFQLSSSDSFELAEATKRATNYGADLIDLNCGCPVKKIRSRGAGSSLLVNAAKLYQLITAMKQNTHLPISIKIRVDGDASEKFNREVAAAVQDAGADFLIVHGRHWTEHYETPCRYDDIKFFVDELKIPVIGNGDIACVKSLKKMYETGCAGVMIGRAGVGQPWLIKKLIAELTQQTYVAPSLTEIGAVFIEHIEGLIDLLGTEKFSIFQARKLAKYYARNMPERTRFCTAMNTCGTLIELKNLCSQFFKTE
jgi:tRNA-dihydrouridine synthase B